LTIEEQGADEVCEKGLRVSMKAEVINDEGETLLLRCGDDQYLVWTFRVNKNLLEKKLAERKR